MKLTKYYFDLDDGDNFHRDEEGVEAPSLKEVYEETVGLLPEIAKRVLPLGHTREFCVQVRNEAGDIILKATISFEARWLQGQPDGHVLPNGQET